MKHLLITTIAAVLLVGCGESQQSASAPITKLEPPTAKAPDISIWSVAADGNIEAVKQAIADGADVNVKDQNGRTPLQLAALRGHKEVAELLIAKGADVNAQHDKISGQTPLHYAAYYGLKEMVELLIAKGADVNAKQEELIEMVDTGGWTPLHFAANGGYMEVAELLITEGADVNAKNNGGETPLDLAIMRNRTETAALLRKHGGKTGAELKAEGK